MIVRIEFERTLNKDPYDLKQLKSFEYEEFKWKDVKKRFTDNQKFLFNLNGYLIISDTLNSKGSFYINTDSDNKFKPPNILPYYKHYRIVRIHREREKRLKKLLD